MNEISSRYLPLEERLNLILQGITAIFLLHNCLTNMHNLGGIITKTMNT